MAPHPHPPYNSKGLKSLMHTRLTGAEARAGRRPSERSGAERQPTGAWVGRRGAEAAGRGREGPAPGTEPRTRRPCMEAARRRRVPVADAKDRRCGEARIRSVRWWTNVRAREVFRRVVGRVFYPLTQTAGHRFRFTGPVEPVTVETG